MRVLAEQLAELHQQEQGVNKVGGPGSRLRRAGTTPAWFGVLGLCHT